MPTLTFYPLGNADACLIDLANGEKLLFDCGDQRDATDPFDRRIDLSKALHDNFAAAKKTSIEVLAITHLDRDHYNRATELFWLEHSEKYQSSDRIRVDEIWVPAAVIIDDEVDADEGKVLQAEARHRLIKGKGIRVFSRPNLLEEWLASKGISLADRLDCIQDAGTVISRFSRSVHGVEFFVHSPFGHRLNETEVVERNRDAIMVQATFVVSGVETKTILSSDIPWENLQEIVQITRAHGRDERLEWDVCKLPHHCSYLSLSSDKGAYTTAPVDEIKWLYESQGRSRGIIVSSSKVIPGTTEDQPPHVEAARYYRSLPDRSFVVTMEHPTVANPKPLVITIDATGAAKEIASAGVASVVRGSAPRAGRG
jgi:hypothetical protein